MNQDIAKCIEALRRQGPRYARTERYYSGDHDLRFATEKFENTFGDLFREFALNLCPVVCDAVKDKLRVTGFSANAARDEGQAIRSMANAVWHRSRMRTRAGEIHKEVLKNGDAFAIVWPDADGHAAIYPNRAANTTVFYDDERPGTITLAAKTWTSAARRARINLYFADRIERYISKRESNGLLPEANEFIPFADAGASSVTNNPYGVVPVFHFANNADIGSPGRSELDPAIPIQDGLNKSVLDMLVAMEFSAFRQRWAAGIEVDYDDEGNAKAPFSSGVDKLWITGDSNARFGDFEAARLDQFLKVKDSFRVDIACVTGTPLHYFLQNSASFPSGESLRQAGSRFIAKVRDRQEAFGRIWADIITFALRIEGVEPSGEIFTLWEDPSPLSERETLENLLLKQQLGITPGETIAEAGYGSADIVN